MIDRQTVERIYASADIVDVLSDFITLTKKGVNYQACCPFHDEKTPSFVVSPSKGYFKCFGCGKGGNVTSFLMEHESMSYPEALKYLAKKYGIEIKEKEMTPEQVEANNDRESMMVVTAYAKDFFSNKLINSSEGKNIGLSYFHERGFSDAIIEKFQLGYCPSKGDLMTLKALEDGYKEEFLIKTGLTIKHDSRGYYDRFTGRVMFPIHSLSGRVIGFGGRVMSSEKSKAKYLNSPESEIYHKSYTLYGINFARKEIVKQDRCILVEGYTDVISMFQSGVENIVASSGTSLTTDQIKLIKRFTNNITVIYDSDFAGIKASLRGIDMILSEGMNVRVVMMPEGEDPDSFARAHSSTETNDYLVKNEEDFLSFKTKLLIRDTKDDPIGRASVITDVITSISVIPDAIIRSQFIKECSTLLEVDEALVNQEVTKKYISKKSGGTGLSAYNKEFKQTYKPIGQPVVMPVYSQTDDVSELEKELLIYLLRFGDKSIVYTVPHQEPVYLNVAHTIIDELEIDNISFTNKTYNTILQEYKEILKTAEDEFEQREESEGEDENDDEKEVEKPKVTASDFINHSDPKVCDFVIDIMTREDKYRSSKIWQKFNIVESVSEEYVPNLDIVVPKTLALYKLRFIEKIIKELVQELKKSGDMNILKQIDALNESRKMINKQYSRIV
ncbi:MAG: DNA primase [Bacteroidetes bacterium]|nr:DNA primase [Bacteroidota bacterium]